MHTMQPTTFTRCGLIADTREKNVLRHADALSNISLMVKQITTGDYIVVDPIGNAIAVIERKSLEDFGASLKDGRHLNKSKLVEFRNATGCRIIYIIEGPAFPRPDQYFSGIAYKNIESSIYHLMIRETAQILRTENTLGTARALASFVASMDSLWLKNDCDDTVGGSEFAVSPLLAVDSATTDSPFVAPMVDSTVEATTVEKPNLEKLLTAKHEKTIHDVVAEMWSQFPGIAVTTADDFIRVWKLGDVVRGVVPRDTICKHKMANGRAISKKVVTSLSGMNKLIEVRLLSTVTGISHASAVELTNQLPLKSILEQDVKAISDMTIGKSKKRIGVERAANILKYFNYGGAV